jgi:GWxTD domain-containing protein
VLAGARRFARRSGGHPHALLLAGLALHELGSLDAAAEHFEAALQRLPPGDAEAIRDLSLVIDPVQRADYRRLWGDERRAWEIAFWVGRDRTPATVVNEREVQHLARSAYAHLRFGGTASDAGEVWVRFGGPNAIHIVDAGSGQLTEFWDYGSGPDITFARWVASQAMDLTPEGRAYVDDLGNIFPPQ